MSDNKTRPESTSPEAFLASVANPVRREDGFALLDLMAEVSGLPAVMWGQSMVGFGSCHYKYESGREGDMFVAGFSPRSSAISLYLYGGQREHQDALARLGKHKTGKGCIYITRLSDVDLDVVRGMVRRSFDLARSADS